MIPHNPVKWFWQYGFIWGHILINLIVQGLNVTNLIVQIFKMTLTEKSVVQNDFFVIFVFYNRWMHIHSYFYDLTFQIDSMHCLFTKITNFL